MLDPDPRKAQKMIASEAGTLCTSAVPEGLQESEKVCGSKAATPAATATTIGARPMARATAARPDAVRAPMM